MNYLSSQEILFSHYRLTEEIDGTQGITNVGILKKIAIYIKNNDVFPDKFSKSSALFFAIAKKKPFLDLNTQSALLLTKLFLAINDVVFHIENKEIREFVKNKLSKASVEDIKKIIIDNSTNIT
jgi:prophage maintenance system killer protein